eukprot:TRINITY_DN23228_c0_g3_i1.p1 TRINITY_DN23228_c0_g3~~TRINITY_DN23228_c0_g3_i1.p1  ORF type:complete len:501 (-),score=83.92 TRINITY_DN23228_c0_g3_i1:56-1558(-)
MHGFEEKRLGMLLEARLWLLVLPLLALASAAPRRKRSYDDSDCWVAGRTYERCCILSDPQGSSNVATADCWMGKNGPHEGLGEFSFERCCSPRLQHKISVNFDGLVRGGLSPNRSMELFGSQSWGVLVVRKVPGLAAAMERLLAARIRVFEHLRGEDVPKDVNCDSVPGRPHVNHPRSDAVRDAGCAVAWRRAREGHVGEFYPVAFNGSLAPAPAGRPAEFPEADRRLHEASADVSKLLFTVFERAALGVHGALRHLHADGAHISADVHGSRVTDAGGSGGAADVAALLRLSDYAHLNQVIYPSSRDGGRPWGLYTSKDAGPDDVRALAARASWVKQFRDGDPVAYDPNRWQVLQEWHRDLHWGTVQAPPVFVDQSTGWSHFRDGTFLLDPSGSMQRFHLGPSDVAVWFGGLLEKLTHGKVRAMPHTVLLSDKFSREWRQLGWERHATQLHIYPVDNRMAGEGEAIPCIRYCAKGRGGFPWKYGVRVDVNVRRADVHWRV